jgi:hypothetical protein
MTVIGMPFADPFGTAAAILSSHFIISQQISGEDDHAG